MSESPEANLPLPRFPITVSPWRNARRRHPLQWLRRLAGRNPQWGLMFLAAGAWVFLAAPHAHAGNGGNLRDVARDSLALAAMVVAMMLPLTIGRALHLARSSPWRRRHHAVTAFLAGYVAVWMLAMVLIDAAWWLAASRTGWITAAVATAGAAVLWEFAAPHLLQPTHGNGVPVAGGGRTAASCARLGMVSAGGCVASCCALMAACVALAHSLPVMMGLFCVQLIGRHRPAASRTASALAVLVICAGSPVPDCGPPHHVTEQTRQDSGREASRPESRCAAFRREPLAVHVARHYSAGRRDSSPPAHSRHAHQPAAPVLAL